MFIFELEPNTRENGDLLKSKGVCWDSMGRRDQFMKSYIPEGKFLGELLGINLELE